jgi:hypothetical protein
MRSRGENRFIKFPRFAAGLYSKPVALTYSRWAGTMTMTPTEQHIRRT